jgi:LPS O-antigen subunit length determinant protein (WzzB/FepE family)
MTAPTDQFVDIANRSQEAVTAAVRSWTDTVQSVAGKLTSGQSQLPDLQNVVDQYFDFVEQVLANQRQFVQQWASATVKATESVTEQAQRATQSVAAHSANGAEAVVDGAAETARAAGVKAGAAARAARNATKA